MTTFAQETGVDPLALIQEYGDVARTIADLAAEWSGGGVVYDSKRKALWCAIAHEYRTAAAESGQKITEAALEQAAHADERYQRFVRDAEARAVRYHTAQARLKEIEETLQLIRATEYRAGREAGLTR